MKKTKDPVNQTLLEIENEIGLQNLGLMNNQVWYNDPRRLVFTLSRYKFVSKMLSGKDKVAEIGCGDGFGSRIVKQEVNNLLITDYDEIFIKNFRQSNNKKWKINALVHDILDKPLNEKYNAIYSLDVLEHIELSKENLFLDHISKSLLPNGVAIIGMPSIESQTFASKASIEGHVNCKTGNELKKSMEIFFNNVFIFSMNDEMVHTGFNQLAHYLIALCTDKK